MSWFQLPYREARDGFWGEQTSTLNWCEEDYNITHYCAELVNTLTNLTFIWLGVSGIRDCMRFSHPSIFFVAFAGYIIVGMGSMAFHATLKYSMQLADELPMIYATCIIGYATFSFGKSRALQTVVGLSLFSLALFITVVYYITKDPVFHEVSYGVLTAAIVFRAMFIMKYQLHPALELRSTDRAAAIMSQMWKMCFTGIGMFLLGFLIWNLDNVYCSHLLSWRQILLLPWSLVLEGHGWWHLFTGLGGTFMPIGPKSRPDSRSNFVFPLLPARDFLLTVAAYYFIAWRIWLHRCLEGKEDEYMLQWPSPYTSVPRVVPIYEGDNGKDRKIL